MGDEETPLEANPDTKKPAEQEAGVDTQITDEDVINDFIKVYESHVDRLIFFHADWGTKSTQDLGADRPENAIWKLSGQSLAYAKALLLLLKGEFTGQCWPTIRAIHEVNRFVAAVCEPEEENIRTRWLANKEVKQAKARAAEDRGAKRVEEEMRAAGLEPNLGNLGEMSGKIYGHMSDAAHSRRYVVDEGIDEVDRVFYYERDPRLHRRLEMTVYVGELFEEVILLDGNALMELYGPGFYEKELRPQVEAFQGAMAELRFYEKAKALGLIP